jgi:hypothetical protein
VKTEIPRAIRILNFHGVGAVSSGGSNWVGHCPFCKKQKLYVEPEEGLWDCKVCGERGNQFTFLKKFIDTREEAPLGEWLKLTESRKIPKDVLAARDIKWDGKHWYLPIYSETGSVRATRRYDYKQLMIAAGCEAQLFGMRELAQAKQNATVHLCEGEWDAIAMDWLLKESGITDQVVVAVPGASTFKSLWIPFFASKRVVCYFDNDAAGDGGAERVKKLLTGSVKELLFVNWPDTLPQGFDLRDFIVSKLSATNEPMAVWSELSKLTQTAPRRDLSKKDAVCKPMKSEPGNNSPTTIKDVLEAFGSKIRMTEDLEVALKISLAVSISNDFSGDPLWVYLVGPPGCGKTMVLSALSTSDRCVFRSALTTHCLVSGWQGSSGDPSLIPKLTGLTLVAKDFTEILAMPKLAQDEIFSTLRGAYDGSVQKSFGNGVTRSYDNCRFSMVAGVTNAIHAHRSASLGERFLKVQIKQIDGAEATELIEVAMASIGQERETENTLQEICTKFLAMTIDPKQMPRLTKAQGRRLTALVQLIAVMRAVVERDARTQDILYRPVPETGTRLAKQLARLAICLTALTPGREEVDAESFRIVERVAKDTAHGFYFDVIEAAMKLGGKFTKGEIAKASALPVSTAWRQMDDLCLLNVITSTTEMKEPSVRGGAPAVIYSIHPKIAELWKLSQGESPCHQESRTPDMTVLKVAKPMLLRSKTKLALVAS